MLANRRRITVAVVASLAIHALIFSIPMRKRPGEPIKAMPIPAEIAARFEVAAEPHT